MLENIKDAQKGQPISAGTFNAIKNQVSTLSKINVAAPLQIDWLPAPTISLGQTIPFPTFPANISGTATGGAYTWEEVAPGTNGTWVTLPHGRTSTNTANCYPIMPGQVVPTGTGVAGSIVLLAEIPVYANRGTNAANAYIFQPKPAVAQIKLTSDAAGGGKYNGRILSSPTGTLNATNDLHPEDIGTDPGADNCLVYNRREINVSTHSLTITSDDVIYLGIYVGMSNQTPSLPVYVIDGFQFLDTWIHMPDSNIIDHNYPDGVFSSPTSDTHVINTAAACSLKFDNRGHLIAYNNGSGFTVVPYT